MPTNDKHKQRAFEIANEYAREHNMPPVSPAFRRGNSHMRSLRGINITPSAWENLHILAGMCGFVFWSEGTKGNMAHFFEVLSYAVYNEETVAELKRLFVNGIDVFDYTDDMT